MKKQKKITIVVSVYNEEDVLSQFYREAMKILPMLPWEYELLFVNDGSKDRSLFYIKEFAESNKNVKYISFSRNFGHEAAMIAGIDHASGDGIVCMDADLQHPLECLPQIIEKFEEGYEVINMVRTQNKDAGWIKNLTSSAFYKLINVLSSIHFEENASDFFAISGRVARVLKDNYRERVRFLRGYVQNVGFKKTTLNYAAHSRAAGQSKYNIRKLFRFSINTILCFSDLPLKLGGLTSIGTALVGVGVLVYTLFTRNGAPSGYATIVILNCFMFAILFGLLGIIGEYIAIIFTELKERPIYIVEESLTVKIP